MTTNRPRKTIDVEFLKKKLNAQILACIPEYRPVLCGVLEDILMESNNYKGFSYVNEFGMLIPASEVSGLDCPTYFLRRYY